ncbi:MAG TPA: twin-arginine translocation signal domain-containing protein [Terriglobia bacterium]|nr:twin-arginine translocation signal domain-containing protein [Terriglobia bacterium]
MDRRRFLQDLAAATAAVGGISTNAEAAQQAATNKSSGKAAAKPALRASDVNVDGHTLVSEFKVGPVGWKVYEDLRTRDGALTFISSQGAARVLGKSAEASFAEADPYLGLSLKEIGMTARDLLADKLLEKGDPDPEQVKSACPPQGTEKIPEGEWYRYRWDAIVGTKECSDTMPVFPPGNTRTYHPVQFFPELSPRSEMKRFDGLVGGWMPAVRKVFVESEADYYELIVFGDVEAHDRFIVQTWHRTVHVENGKVSKAVYGYSYPPFPPARVEPKPEEFYRGLLVFAEYWDKQLHDFAETELPRQDWVDMSKHAFAKELIVRPGGVYPKYGAVDRDYYGSEYDGFQDIFTMATYTNLEWGRFDMARDIIDNFFTDFVDSKGVNNMRGPETAHFGLTLSLLARYYNYTGDGALLRKHRKKIEATASVLTDLHDISLKLPEDDPGHGIIHGWSESDSCLWPTPKTWWLPYFANNAYSARGLLDISRVWAEVNPAQRASATRAAQEWLHRSQSLQGTLIASMQKDLRKDMTPPYIGLFPGAKMTFWESMQKEKPPEQMWAHRPYAELLQADVIPHDLANNVADCMRAYGATTVGIVANVEPPHETGRDILGFISYGHAQMLLRLDRIEEFLLFLYAHRYHDHTRGSWVAGEVSGITGDRAIFCIPAQQTIPLLVRWMLVLEDSDEDRVYFGKGLPREWMGSGNPIRIHQAPTRFGRVNFSLQAQLERKVVTAKVELAKAGSPREIQVKFRVPADQPLNSVTVNGKAARFSGPHGDSVTVKTAGEKSFEVIAQLA